MKTVGWQRLLAAAAGAYVTFGVALAVFQRRLLYLPQRLSAEAARAAFVAEGLAPWPGPDGAAYRGLVRRGADGAEARGTVLLFHGNAGSARDRAPYGEALGPLGWRVILAEYPGYGARPGRPSEAAFVADARETARLARRLHPGPLVVMGESLGAGVAAAVAADPEARPDAVVLATPWDRLATVAAHHYPWLPVRAFLRDRFDSVAYLAEYAGPVTVLLAECDEIVPPAATRALYEGLSRAERKRLVQIAGATHNDWFWLVGEARWREILEP